MKKFELSPRTTLIAVAFLLAACAAPAPTTPPIEVPTWDLAALETEIAGNVFAALTQTASAIPPSDTPEPTATNTTEPATPIPTFTPTEGAPSASPSPTAVSLPTSTTAPIACNAAQLVSDISVANGSLFEASAKFTKIWRIKNVGSCTWGDGYRIRFADGTNLAEKSSYQSPPSCDPMKP